MYFIKLGNYFTYTHENAYNNYGCSNKESILKYVPIDRTPLSIKASTYAIHLAQVEKAKELIMMHVVEDVNKEVQ
jgi:hypothetical protein